MARLRRTIKSFLFYSEALTTMDWSLFEYEVSSGFDCTEQEQKAIAKLEKILGDRLFDLTIHNGEDF